MSLDLAVKEFEYSRLPRPERIRLLLEELSIFESTDEIAVVLDRYVNSNFTKLPGSLDAASQV